MRAVPSRLYTTPRTASPASGLYELSRLPLLPALPSLHHSAGQPSTCPRVQTWPWQEQVQVVQPRVLHKQRVYVALSGGVDSATSAWLLQEAGWDVECVYMQTWDEREERYQCNGKRDLKDAQDITRHLHLSHDVRVIDLSREYWHDVFCEMVEGYQQGLTPNPDVLCNRQIKCQALLHKLHINDDGNNNRNSKYLATGHYACTQRIDEPISDTVLDTAQFILENSTEMPEQEINLDKLLASLVPPSITFDDIGSVPKSGQNAFHRLLTARDHDKDQTYFLSLIRPKCIKHLLFPLGTLCKLQTRALALKAGLSVATKPDSMGICMIGRRHFARFISDYIRLTPGVFKTLEENRIIGNHQGIELYTIGQRAALGGQKHKWYVCAKGADGTVTVVKDYLHPALLYDIVYISHMNWLSGRIPKILLSQGMMVAYCRLRSTEKLRQCTVHVDHVKQFELSKPTKMCDLGDDRVYRVEFPDQPHCTVSLGQILALYLRGVCLGGAPIVATGPSHYELMRQHISSNAQ